MKATAKNFKNRLKHALEDSPKTSWGKRELALFIEEIYSEFLEDCLPIESWED